MELRLGKNSGFCSGVRHAVTLAEDAAKTAAGQKVFTYGELMHNPQELERLRKLGVETVETPETLDNMPQGASLIIRSHGVAPKVLEQCLNDKRGINVIDATCQYVKRLHSIAAKASRSMPVIIVGSAKHPEVIGTAGWCEGEVFIIANADEAVNVPMMTEAAAIAQTTIAPEMFSKAIAALKQRVVNLTVFNTICSVTAKRQEEAIELAKWADVMLVVGGANSSNTKQLADTCKIYCECVYYISSAEELKGLCESKQADAGNLKDKGKIGVVSGASTPQWILSEVTKALCDSAKPDA